MKYIITLFTLLFVFSLQSFAENTQETTYLLRGRVLSADTNQPLTNANIMVQQTNVSTVTNLEGYFSIRVPFASRNGQLLIRHLGYENHTIPVVRC